MRVTWTARDKGAKDSARINDNVKVGDALTHVSRANQISSSYQIPFYNGNAKVRSFYSESKFSMMSLKFKGT